MIVPLVSSELLSTQQALIALSLGLLGGVLPDLDSDNSKPVSISFKILSIFIPLLVLISLNDNELSILQMIGAWLLSSILLALTLFKLFLNLTVHRGIFHTLPMGFVFFQLISIIFYKFLEYDMLFSSLAGFFVFFGFLVHLLLDEFVSLNILGISIKQSFGTAFKFYDRNNKIGSGFLYLIIIGLYLYQPLDFSIFSTMIEAFRDVKFL